MMINNRVEQIMDAVPVVICTAVGVSMIPLFIWWNDVDEKNDEIFTERSINIAIKKHQSDLSPLNKEVQNGDVLTYTVDGHIFRFTAGSITEVPLDARQQGICNVMNNLSGTFAEQGLKTKTVEGCPRLMCREIGVEKRTFLLWSKSYKGMACSYP